MKTRLVSVLLTLMAALLPLSIQGQVNLDPTLAAVMQSGSGDCVIQVSNPGNGGWTLELSSNLQTWSAGPSFRVVNSRFSFPLDSLAASGPVFFRMYSNETAAATLNTVAAALGLPASPTNYSILDLPAHLQATVIQNQDNTPANNAVTDVGATLGRVLFYDKRLSANNTTACSSCHLAEHGFADPRPKSVGFNGGLTGRNSMGLSSARYYAREHFFWDERAATLEDQVLMPIQDSVEMGMTLEALEIKLAAEPYYTNLFQQAFGDVSVTSDRISKALAQFIRSMVSTQSRYDIGLASGFSNFTDEEKLGRRLFRGEVGNATCSTCHATDNFVPAFITNNGLENPLTDLGVGGITGLSQDEGKFKVPSLRNIELTAPYMHDGRFATLEEVVAFYDSGVVDHPNLSPPMLENPGDPNSGPRQLNLTQAQKDALVAYMKTLTDTNLLTDPRFQDPFRYGLP